MVRWILFRLATWAKYCALHAAHARRLSLHVVRAAMRRPPQQRIGFVTLEFFHEQLGGFGGYGKTVQNLTDAFNGTAPTGPADVLLPIPARGGSFLRRYHHADVLLAPPAVTRLKDIPMRTKYVWRLQRRMLDVLITSEYYRHYEQFLDLLPRTPTIIWIHDPRPERDWHKIASMTLDVDGARKSAEREIVAVRRSLEAIVTRSRETGRPIVFAHQAECLTAKARDLYALPDLTSTFLPNPVTIPQEPAAKSLEPTICFLGRLDPVKRPWMFCELAKRFPKVTFLVAGETHFPDIIHPILARYRDLPNLHFLGRLDGPDKDLLLQRSWGLVNTSIHEALPVSFLEALSACTPIVSCQDPDGIARRFGWYTGEIRGDGFDDVSLDSFATALMGLLTDRDVALSRGEEGRAFVKAGYSMQNFRACLEAICKNL